MDQLNIVQWNAQSIRSNRHIFSHFLIENNIHVALLCETWLKPEMRFNLKDYNTVRLHSGNNHNGVAILIHNSLQFKKIDTSYDSIQNIAIRLKYGGKELPWCHFIVLVINCNPSFSKSKLDNLIKSISGPVLIVGDFNAHHSAWGCSAQCSRGVDVLESINDNNLVLLNNADMTTVG